MADERELRQDIDGYEVLTTALVDLVNDFPLLDDEKVRFNVLKDRGGKAFFPLSGAVIEREIKDILGGVEQRCVYPFMVIYRSAGLNENRRKAVKEWLDKLGRWLEGQEIDGNRLTEYPTLSGNRRITEIRRQSPAYQMDIHEDGTEDWSISITARYRNEF